MRALKLSRSHTVALAVVLSICTFMMMGGKSAALSGSDFQAGRVIDDSVFTNAGAMNDSNPGQPAWQYIQNFLNAKIGTCDTNGTRASSHWDSAANRYYTDAEWGSMHGDPAPFTCINFFVENPTTQQNNYANPSAQISGGQTAAQIIWNAAQANDINPEVILVTLQKEQGLVTDYWPWYNEYQEAMGYSCPDTGNCNASYSDFAAQVNGAAAQMHYAFTHPGAFNYWIGNNYILYNPNTSCGGSTVNIQNAATAVLYIYTPYQPNAAALNNLTGTGDSCSAYGVRNFWYYFNSWFGSTTGTALVKGSGAGVYLVNGSTRYGVPSEAMLQNYGMAQTAVTPASDAYIQGLTNGGVLGTLFTVSGDPATYVADNGVKYAIPSGAVCTSWGFNCSSGVAAVSFATASSMNSGGALQSLMLNNNVIYNMQNGVRSPYVPTSAMTGAGFSMANVTPMSSSYNVNQSIGTPIVADNTLVRFGNYPAVYYYTDNHYYAFPNGATLTDWFGNTSITSDGVSSYAANNTNGPTINSVMSSIVKTSDGHTYILEGGQRIDVTDRASIWPTPLIASDLDSTINGLPLLATDSSASTYRTPEGAIFALSNGQKMPIASMTDFYALGYSPNNVIQVSDDTMSMIPTGLNDIGEGSVFKTNGSSVLYLKGPGQSVYWLNSLAQLSQYQLTRQESSIQPTNQLTLYSAPQPLNSFVGLNGSASVTDVVDGEARMWLFGTTQANLWGITPPTPTNMTSSGATIAGLTFTNQALPQFASYNGTIYYATGGAKHPISNYGEYLQLGGNTSNTFPATADFINAAPTGSIY